MLTLERVPTAESLCHSTCSGSCHEIHHGSSARSSHEHDPEKGDHVEEPVEKHLETINEGNLPDADYVYDGPDEIYKQHTREIEYPEGGLKAWLVVFGSWLALICTFGYVNAIGSIQSYLLQNQLKGYSESQVSWIFSIWLFCMYTGSVQVGPIFDAYGIRVLLIPGTIIYVFSIMILSICKEYYQFILGYSILGGVAIAMIFNPCVTVIGHYFCKNRAFATGLALTGGAIGGIIFPIMLPRLFESVGFGWAIRIVAFIILAVLIVACCLVDARKLRSEDSPKQAMIDFKALKDVQFLFTSLALFALEWAFFAPISYIVLYAEAQGGSSNWASTLIAVLNAMSVLGRTLPSYLGDKYGVFNMAVLTNVVSGLFVLTIWLTVGTSKGGLLAFTVLYGFFSGASSALIPSCIGRISDTRQYGTRYGTSYFVASIATLTGLPICGALGGDNYTGTIAFTGANYIAGGVCYLIARLSRGNYRNWNF